MGPQGFSSSLHPDERYPRLLKWICIGFSPHMICLLNVHNPIVALFWLRIYLHISVYICIYLHICTFCAWGVVSYQLSDITVYVVHAHSPKENLPIYLESQRTPFSENSQSTYCTGVSWAVERKHQPEMGQTTWSMTSTWCYHLRTCHIMRDWPHPNGGIVCPSDLVMAKTHGFTNVIMISLAQPGWNMVKWDLHLSLLGSTRIGYMHWAQTSSWQRRGHFSHHPGPEKKIGGCSFSWWKILSLG